MGFETSLAYAIVLFTATAAIIDCAQRRIPNWLTLSTLLLGLAFYGLIGGASGMLFSLAGFATGFTILLVLWLVGGGGGGDVKLMAALGALLGAKLTLVVFFLSAMLALAGVTVLAAIDVIFGGLKALRKSRQPSRRMIPYALPVAGSAWLVLVWQIALSGAGS